ncbi:replication protein, partial [Bacillus paranthracis]|nr:replication protein [Bacillus paranthracis]
MPAEVRKLDEQRKINVELTPEQLQMLQRLIDLEQQENKDKEQFEENKKNHNLIQLYRDNMPELRWLM